MKRKRYWPDVGSRWWSVCVLAALTPVWVGAVQVAYFLVHGKWMLWH